MKTGAHRLSRERCMAKSGRGTGGYALAVILGAVGGGIAVAVATKALPKMMSQMMRRMSEQMREHGIDPAEM